jgi:membrane-bound serine protease (ClpP class)
MLIGGLIMYRAPGGELLNVSVGFIFGVTFVIGAVFLFVLRMAYKALRRKPSSGLDIMIGERVVILENEGSADSGMMTLLHGEYWRVSCDEGERVLSPGDEAIVTGVESMILQVKPVDEQ